MIQFNIDLRGARPAELPRRCMVIATNQDESREKSDLSRARKRERRVNNIASTLRNREQGAGLKAALKGPSTPGGY